MTSQKDLQIQVLRPEQMHLLVPLLRIRNSVIREEVLRERLGEMFTQGFTCVGAFKEATIVGMAGFWIKTRYHTGKVIELDAVLVDPEYRSMGIGEKLTKWVLSYGSAQGCLESELHCYVSNGDAHRFWFNQGYQIIAFHFGKMLGKDN